MLLLEHDDVAGLLAPEEIIDAMRGALLEQSKGLVQVPPRITVDSSSGFGWLRTMPAILNGSKVMGFKAMHSTPGVGVGYFVDLYDLPSGELLAMMDADWLTAQRTAATAAIGVDVIQFDEPAFNVYMDEVSEWGIKALERAAEGLTCATAVHICYGYGIKANTDWKETLGNEWRQYEDIFPTIAKSPIQQVAIECRNSRVPLELLGLLTGKVVQAGVIDVASDTVETAEDVAGVIDAVSKFVPKSHIVATTNCGMAPMHRDIAEAKLMALGAGARLARQRLG